MRTLSIQNQVFKNFLNDYCFQNFSEFLDECTKWDLEILFKM